MARAPEGVGNASLSTVSSATANESGKQGPESDEPRCLRNAARPHRPWVGGTGLSLKIARSRSVQIASNLVFYPPIAVVGVPADFNFAMDLSAVRQTRNLRRL